MHLGRFLKTRANSDEKKKKAWKQYYERLLHAEFSWCEEDLSEVDPVLGPPPVITQEMVEKSISKMKKAKAPVPSGVVWLVCSKSLQMSVVKWLLTSRTSLFVTKQCLENAITASLLIYLRIHWRPFDDFKNKQKKYEVILLDMYILKVCSIHYTLR